VNSEAEGMPGIENYNTTAPQNSTTAPWYHSTTAPQHFFKIEDQLK